MKKGIFSIPVYDSNVSMDVILEEVYSQIIKSDKLGIDEAFFGEHITDKHEKITSSLMMVAALAKSTKKINLGTLTTNLNFHNPAVAASLISMADNLCKGRLMLGIGSGANMSDIESINSVEKKNRALTLEIQKIIEKLLSNTENLVDIKTENFIISTKKFGNKDLGLGYFNGLYGNRQNLEILMPALNENSYNVTLCAKNNWSIVISNFCSEKIIENHINNYLENSNLSKTEALKKIKLSKLIFTHEDKNKVKDLVFSDMSPFMKVIDVIFHKLKKFNKHHSCFGKNVNSTLEAAKSILLYGDPVEVSQKIKDKYGGLSSIIYVTVPLSKNQEFNKSLDNFASHVSL